MKVIVDGKEYIIHDSMKGFLLQWLGWAKKHVMPQPQPGCTSPEETGRQERGLCHGLFREGE